MLVLCMLMESEAKCFAMKVTLLCGRHCRVKHTECHREPFVVKSLLPRKKAALWHPLKTAYSAGTQCILKRFTTHLELCALCPKREASQCTEIIQ